MCLVLPCTKRKSLSFVSDCKDGMQVMVREGDLKGLMGVVEKGAEPGSVRFRPSIGGLQPLNLDPRQLDKFFSVGLRHLKSGA